MLDGANFLPWRTRPKPPWLVHERLPSPSVRARAVGLLYIVFAQNSTTTRNDKAANLKRYLYEAADSARYSTALDPSLPTALATNVHKLVDREAFSFVVRPLADGEADGLPLWLPRVIALAASPFELTLALDSHAAACSNGLHAALLREHALNRLDIAFNVESTLGLPRKRAVHQDLPLPWRWPLRPGRDIAPRRASELLPHNWALLVRRGARSRLVLERWASALRCTSCRWANDQYALQAVLHAAQSEARFDVRVMRMTERAATALKSVDKSSVGFFPRYTRLIVGPALTTHSRRLAYRGGKADVCRVLNAQPALPRILLQLDARSAPLAVYNRSACFRLLAAAPHRAQLLCTLLPKGDASLSSPGGRVREYQHRPGGRMSLATGLPHHSAGTAPGGAELELVEPLEAFWQWVRQWPDAIDTLMTLSWLKYTQGAHRHTRGSLAVLEGTVNTTETEAAAPAVVAASSARADGVALCLVGELRTFAMPLVHLNILRAAQTWHADVFTVYHQNYDARTMSDLHRGRGIACAENRTAMQLLQPKRVFEWTQRRTPRCQRLHKATLQFAQVSPPAARRKLPSDAFEATPGS